MSLVNNLILCSRISSSQLKSQMSLKVLPSLLSIHSPLNGNSFRRIPRRPVSPATRSTSCVRGAATATAPVRACVKLLISHNPISFWVRSKKKLWSPSKTMKSLRHSRSTPQQARAIRKRRRTTTAIEQCRTFWMWRMRTATSLTSRTSNRPKVKSKTQSLQKQTSWRWSNPCRKPKNRKKNWAEFLCMTATHGFRAMPRSKSTLVRNRRRVAPIPTSCLRGRSTGPTRRRCSRTRRGSAISYMSLIGSPTCG